VFSWVNEDHRLRVDKKVEVKFRLSTYKDQAHFVVAPLKSCDLILGRPWQYDLDVIHEGKLNVNHVKKDGIWHRLPSMSKEAIRGTKQGILNTKNAKEEPRPRRFLH